MRNNVFFVALFILSLSLFFFIRHSDRNDLEKSINFEKRPQEYMKQVAVAIFTDEGNLKNELSANYWAYLPNTQKSQLIIPHLTIYKADGTVWTIDSKQAEVEQPSIGILENIFLKENVIIKRLESLHTIPLLLETEEIKYQPKVQYAESQKIIKMTKPGIIITGIGMKAFLEQGIVELLRDVKTYYTATH